MLLESWTILGQKILEETGASVSRETFFLTVLFIEVQIFCVFWSCRMRVPLYYAGVWWQLAPPQLREYRRDWTTFCPAALSKCFGTSFSVAAEVGISSSFCFRLLGLSCAFAWNSSNSLDFQAAGMYFVLERLQQIGFLNLGALFHDLSGLPLLKKALGKQPVVFKKLRFSCCFQQVSLEQGSSVGARGQQRLRRWMRRAWVFAVRNPGLEPVWEVSILSFLKAVGPRGPLSSQDCVLLLWA